MKLHYEGSFGPIELLWPPQSADANLLDLQDVVVHVTGPRLARRAIANALATVEFPFPPRPPRDPGALARVLAIAIDELELSVRTYNCLSSIDVKTIGDLVKKTPADLLQIPNFGRISFREVTDLLHHFDLTLAQFPPAANRP